MFDIVVRSIGYKAIKNVSKNTFNPQPVIFRPYFVTTPAHNICLVFIDLVINQDLMRTFIQLQEAVPVRLFELGQ